MHHAITASVQCQRCHAKFMETELLGCKHRFCSTCFINMFDEELDRVRCILCLEALERQDEPGRFNPLSPREVDYTSKSSTPVRSINHETMGDANFNPRSVAVHPLTSEIYVLGRDERIHIFSRLGDLVHRFGAKGAGIGQFNNPFGIAVSPRDEVIVADTGNRRIQILTPKGEFVRTFGKEGTGDNQFLYPTAIAYENGHIYVCDYKRIKIFDLHGKSVRAFSHTEIRLLGSIVAGNDQIIVTDHHGHSVFIFNKNGQLLNQGGEKGDEKGKFKDPWGVSVDKKGNIVVADMGNKRLQVITGAQVGHVIEVDGFPGDVSVIPDGNLAVVTWCAESEKGRLLLV